MKILLAVDGSSFTKKMLAYLTTHLEMFSGDIEFTALTVQAPLPPRARAAVGKEVVDTYYAEEAKKVLEPVIKFLTRHNLKVKSLSKIGNAGDTIAKTAGLPQAASRCRIHLSIQVPSHVVRFRIVH